MYALVFSQRNRTTHLHLVLQDIGCAVGSLITFFWGESIGRKRMIMAGAITMLIGTVRALSWIKG